MGRPSRYPDEFRHQAVQMALATQDSPASVARWRGISEMTPRKWVANYLAGEARQADPLAVSPSEFEELRRLRCEAGELRAEKEIVRKAADYFAQETIRSAVSGSSPITVRLRRQAALPGPRCLPLGVLRRRRPAATPAAAPPAPRWPFPPAPHSSSPASPSAPLAGAETTPPPGPFFAPSDASSPGSTTAAPGPPGPSSAAHLGWLGERGARGSRNSLCASIRGPPVTGMGGSQSGEPTGPHSAKRK